MQVTVKKWGNGAAVRLPASVLDAAQLRLDQSVTVRAEDGRVIIEALQSPTFDIDELVARITDDNRHDAIQPGPPVGREVW